MISETVGKQQDFRNSEILDFRHLSINVGLFPSKTRPPTQSQKNTYGKQECRHRLAPHKVKMPFYQKHY